LVEIIAATIGAAVGIASTGAGALLNKNNKSSESVIRLTAAVEHIAGEVSLMRTEMREDRAELFGRISHLEQRLASIEGRQ
tara:strand:- start:169 stop:411 length:243 start_codon:yes stop_codon:yes gene_type:complete